MPDSPLPNQTKRTVSPGAEEILGLYFPVLDHGFVALIDYMGSDEDIERAARVSYGFGTRKRSQTRGLLRHLHRHWRSCQRLFPHQQEHSSARLRKPSPLRSRVPCPHLRRDP